MDGKRKRGKKSEYTIQLMEKQKLNTLRILEKQFRVYSKASATKVLLVKFFLQLCEAGWHLRNGYIS
jgi:small subunit ribosomal protein S4